jgi:DNA topoisomerase-1
MSNKYPILRNVTIIKIGQNKYKYSFKYTWKNGKPITDDVYIQRINKLRIPPAYRNVNIFSPTSKIQYTALDHKQRVQKGYHPVWIQERNRKKFRYLTEFVTAYPKIVKKINTLLPSSGIPTTKEQMVGLAAGLLDVCRIRPGSDKHLRDTGSYGTTTLCKKHITKKTTNGKTYIYLKFVGKSGVTNECILKYNTKIAKNLYNLSQKRKSLNSSIFDTSNYKVTGHDINIFLQEIGGKYISSKSFRTYHANIAFLQKIIPSINEKMSNSERKKHTIEIIKKVAEELHHNPATFNNSYLFTPLKDLYIENPDSFKKIFNNKDLNKTFSTFIKNNTSRYSNVPKNWK